MADPTRHKDGSLKVAAPSKSFQAGMKKVLADKEEVEKLKQRGVTSIYYDHQSPSVRSRRRTARQEFEWFVIMHLELDSENPELQGVIWNVDTFIVLSKLWLSCVATFVKGQVGAKPKAGVLFQRKEAIYWWAIRKVERFTEIYGMWHAQCVSLITNTADLEGFEKGNYQKNTLSDSDIALFFKALQKYPRGRDNWKQNYVIWVLVYLTGVRSSSFSVGRGYEKGAPLGDGSLTRETDETLRWSDCEFRRTEQGIIVTVSFRYLKGHRNAHSSKNTVAMNKKWTFVPSSSSRYEFDLALLLTGTAFSRGLFKAATLEELLDGDDAYPTVSEEINGHPVFLKANQAEALIKGAPMYANVSNEKLQTICKDHGYYGRNTLYSLRRIALIELKRKRGTEFASESASHVPDGKTIYSYDTIGQADIDWTAERLDQAGMSRKSLRQLYEQGNTEKLDLEPATDRARNSRSEQLDVRVDAMLLDDADYVAGERALRSKMEAIAGRFGEEDSGQTSSINRFKTKLIESGEESDNTLLGELEELLKVRKNLKRVLRKKYEKVVKETMLAEHKASMRVARTGAGPKRVVVSKDQVLDARPIVDEAEGRIAQEINDLVANPIDDESDDNIEFEDEAEDAQEIWSELPDEITLDVNRADDDDLAATDQGRLAFLRGWLRLQSARVSDLACLKCALDDTVPQGRKDARFALNKLDRHLKSSYHSRGEQLIRAFNIDQGFNATAPCPLCGKEINAAGKFSKHVASEHPEQLE